ncbi:tRNA (adenosine(37)-N6)-dimethylallyltransferase MiaA [Penaeicola halotolerans]|uniref:tRNA (adenosine(37)-N6)-dimethylallyltransferase MiaA n=1 Tax=Penaeicola halotolerans TaxID=2793196 RepID=UPI001CF842EA|nr:tRNA (adenosine(37)-N6)-dimethylallyltransferase MiaA [Penaeicola halotolerans]
MKKKYLLVVVGPTAVGKTDLCLDLATYFHTEIISADARQFYQEMVLGTAKPSEEELSRVKHHLINNLSIHQNYNIAQFEKDVLQILDQAFQSHDIMILTGGSGLYVQAVCEGIDEMPSIPSALRASLNLQYQEKGLVWLQEEVKKLDPVYYEQVDRQNPQRLIRALEVCLHTSKPFSDFRVKDKVERPFEIIKIGLTRPREELYERIDHRMDLMIEAGLFEEAKSLYEHRALNALQTVGYQEIFAHLEGKYDREEAIRLLKRNSRRYAKRQLTWFGKDESIHWFHPDQRQEIIQWVKEEMEQT